MPGHQQYASLFGNVWNLSARGSAALAQYERASRDGKVPLSIYTGVPTSTSYSTWDIR